MKLNNILAIIAIFLLNKSNCISRNVKMMKAFQKQINEKTTHYCQEYKQKRTCNKNNKGEKTNEIIAFFSTIICVSIFFITLNSI